MADEEKVRSAGVRTPERLLSGKGTAEIVKAAKREIDSTVRVYTKEWLFEIRGTRERCQSYFDKTYAGRVYDDDMKIVESPWGGDHVLYCRRWNAKAEWKQLELAERHAELLRETDLTSEVHVVPRNSRREHELTSYGVLKLPDAKAPATAPV